MKKGEAYLIFKRLLDIVFSFILLLLLALPLCLLALLIMLESDGSALFCQQRVGRNGNIFVCYKLRTMYKNAPPDRPSRELSDRQELITPLGRLLRKSSLDELPQLFNVLRGDMSLVGPRPLIPEEEEIGRIRQRCGVYSVRPGLTGLAQINGRDSLSDYDKARLDTSYTRHISLSSDASILFKTLSCVITARDILH